MRPKEIDKIIVDQTKDFFEKEGFRFSLKERGYIKEFNNSWIRFGFSSLNYHPVYEYSVYLYIRLLDVEHQVGLIDGLGEEGNTYVFPMSYFRNKKDYVNSNPRYEIEVFRDIDKFSKVLIDNYKNSVRDFIPKIIDSQFMLDFLLGEIASELGYANDINTFLRTVFLMKKLNYSEQFIASKIEEYKGLMSDFYEDIQKEYSKLLDDAFAVK